MAAITSYINLYTNNEEVSETNPVTATVTIGNNTEATTTAVLKTKSGYTTEGTITLSFTGDSAARWAASLTEQGTYSNTLEITDPVDANGTTIYFKVASLQDDGPAKDTSVKIKFAGGFVVAA